VFVWWTAFLQQLPFQLFLTLWSTLFFGNMLAFVNVGRAVASGTVNFATVFAGYGLIATLTFLAVPVVFMGLKWANYRTSEYRLLGDRIEFAEGFLTKQHKTVAFSDVREVSLRRGVLQRLAGLGTVYLATQATGGDGWSFSGAGFGSSSGSGVLLRDLAESERVYTDLRARLDRLRAAGRRNLPGGG